MVRNLFVSGTYNKVESDDVSELPNLPDLVMLMYLLEEQFLPEDIHSASIGEIYLETVCGYGGVRYVGETLRIQPRLSVGLERLKYKVCYQGVRLEVECCQNHNAIVNTGERPVVIMLNGISTEIKAGESIRTINDKR